MKYSWQFIILNISCQKTKTTTVSYYKGRERDLDDMKSFSSTLQGKNLELKKKQEILRIINILIYFWTSNLFKIHNKFDSNLACFYDIKMRLKLNVIQIQTIPLEISKK